jgi:serine/threonine protein kinase
MGVVYRARHLHLDRHEVAIKLLYRELARDPAIVDRFFREAKAATKIKNEHIVEVLDFGATPEEDSFLVMELLEGPSLREVLERETRFSMPRTIAIGLQIAEALRVVHEQGIVHRDLKPENVVLMSSGEGELVKILDFGIAQLSEYQDQRLTMEGIVLGTPAYMSPEQATGGQVDHRTDIYALGTMLFEMLAGVCPFVADSAKGVLLAKLTREPPSLREIRAEVPRPLEEVVLRVLHKDPAFRPETMRELILELEEVQSGQQIFEPVAPTYAPTPPRRQLKDLRRFLPLVGVLAGILFGVGLTLLLVKSPPAEQQRQEVARPADARSSSKLPPITASDAASLTTPLTPKTGLSVKAPNVRKTKTGLFPREKRALTPRHTGSAPLTAQPPLPATESKWSTTITSIPPGAEVFRDDTRLGQTPLKVNTTSEQMLHLELLGHDTYDLRVPAHTTVNLQAKLKRATMSWEVLSLSQLQKMLDQGQISKFTYRRRLAQLSAKRDQELLEAKIQLKTNNISEAEYRRLIKAINDNYR